MSESEVFLNQRERLDVIRELLVNVIRAISEGDLKDTGRMLEELVLHVEAAGPELKLNDLETSVLASIKNRTGASPNLIAQRCARLLGALNHEIRFPNEWKSKKDLIKEVFLFDLISKIDGALKEGDPKSILRLEELVSGFIVHEDGELDNDILRLCFGVETCINDVMVYGQPLNTVRLETQKKIALTLQGKLRIALS